MEKQIILFDLKIETTFSFLWWFFDAMLKWNVINRLFDLYFLIMTLCYLDYSGSLVKLPAIVV